MIELMSPPLYNHLLPRRLRTSPQMRSLVRETRLHRCDFVLPLFIDASLTSKKPIPSMPGTFWLTLSDLEEEVPKLVDAGLISIMLFGLGLKKDADGTEGIDESNVMCQAIRKVRALTDKLVIMCDVCSCGFTDHGHCAPIDEKGRLDHLRGAEICAMQAVNFAKAGVDVVCPSGMIDGQVRAMRAALDAAGFEEVSILAHTAKYASAFYGPFRDALKCGLKKGDRACYQLDSANGNEALKEAKLDIEEGADILMVKPAGPYLDVIAKIKAAYPYMPLACYHVSAECSMIKAAAEKGWINEKKVLLETLHGFKRAGANIIVTYLALDAIRAVTALDT